MPPVVLPNSDVVTVRVPVPIECVGLVVGRGGQALKRVSAQTGCAVRLDARCGRRVATCGRLWVVAELTGPPTCVMLAQASLTMDMRRISIDDDVGVTSNKT